jgi:hypothetical protein
MASQLSGGLRSLRNAHKQDLLAGAFFCGVGLLYGGIALRDLPMGQVFNMGPGFFPLMLCGMLLVIGGVLMARSFVRGRGDPLGTIPWRAIGLISLGIAAFAVLLEPLGLLLSVFAATAIAAFAAPKSKVVPSLVAAAAIAVFCVAIFVLGAQLQAPIFGSVFGG